MKTMTLKELADACNSGGSCEQCDYIAYCSQFRGWAKRLMPYEFAQEGIDPEKVRFSEIDFEDC